MNLTQREGLVRITAVKPRGMDNPTPPMTTAFTGCDGSFACRSPRISLSLLVARAHTLSRARHRPLPEHDGTGRHVRSGTGTPEPRSNRRSSSGSRLAQSTGVNDVEQVTCWPRSDAVAVTLTVTPTGACETGSVSEITPAELVTPPCLLLVWA
jgi:hypothetical protein